MRMVCMCEQSDRGLGMEGSAFKNALPQASPVCSPPAPHVLLISLSCRLGSHAVAAAEGGRPSSNSGSNFWANTTEEEELQVCEWGMRRGRRWRRRRRRNEAAGEALAQENDDTGGNDCLTLTLLCAPSSSGI